MSTEEHFEPTGLFQKYEVHRLRAVPAKRGTGAFLPTIERELVTTDCFVLRPDRDPAAREAIRTYAQHCDDAEFAGQLLDWMADLER